MNEFQESSSSQQLPDDHRNTADPAESSQSALAATTGNEYLTRSSQSLIKTPLSSGHPIGTGIRVLLVLWSLFLCAGFALAASMRPDPRGFGTHQSLGFPPCTGMIGLQVAAVYIPFLQTALHTVPLGLQDWGLIVALALPVLVIGELYKWFLRRGDSEVAHV